MLKITEDELRSRGKQVSDSYSHTRLEYMVDNVRVSLVSVKAFQEYQGGPNPKSSTLVYFINDEGDFLTGRELVRCKSGDLMLVPMGETFKVMNSMTNTLTVAQFDTV